MNNLYTTIILHLNLNLKEKKTSLLVKGVRIFFSQKGV